MRAVALVKATRAGDDRVLVRAASVGMTAGGWWRW